MGRTRTKSKKTKAPAPESTGASSDAKSGPAIPALLEKAQSLVGQCDYALALRFAQRILHRDSAHADAREILGVCQLETGELSAAKQTFETLVPPHANAPSPPPPSAYLYLAQLNDDDPHAALRCYQAAVDVLQTQLKGKERAMENNGSDAETDERTIKNTIVRAYVGMVEIWMDPSYDLCFDPAAAETCEALLSAALAADPGNAEALQALASVRMSQSRPDDAKQCLQQAWSAWKDLDLDDPGLPSIEARLALVKLFLELALYTPALLVLQGVMASDDQEVEAWYLEGWCFFLMAEQARESGAAVDGLTWEDLAKDARDCLDTCQMLHTREEHPDRPLLDHTKELIAQLEALGIKTSPDDGEEEGSGDDWEDDDDESGDAEDVEMA